MSIIRFARWLFNSKAAVRPGCFTQVTLLASAAFAMPGLLQLLRGNLFGAAAMLLGGLIPIVLFALPAWNMFRRSERIEERQLQEAQVRHQLQPESVSEPVSADEYSTLREELKLSGQERAVAQLRLLIDKLEDFRSVLNLKFNDTEVTFHRYLDSGQKVFDGALGNLESISAFARSLRSLDHRSLVEQLDVMIANGQGDSRAATALRERLDMMSEGSGHITALLESNEEALTAMTRVSTKLAGISTASADAPDMETMIEDLHDMAERTASYNVKLKRNQPDITLTPS